LQQQVGARWCPAHLLFFHKPFTDHLVDGRFGKPGGDGFSLPVALTTVGDKGSIIGEVSLKGPNRFDWSSTV
jgi:hypothetical protein